MEYMRRKKSVLALVKRKAWPSGAMRDFRRGCEETKIRLLEEIKRADRVEDMKGFDAYVTDLARWGDESMYLPFHVGIYLLAKLTKPKLVVETGVSRGFSTLVLLKALGDNGRLISIELAKQIEVARGERAPIAYVVDEDLRKNWTLLTGDGREVLATLKEPIDLFVSGSDHQYLVQNMELSLADRLVPRGGYIVVDRPDYNENHALLDNFDKPGYSYTIYPERSASSPLKYALVWKK